MMFRKLAAELAHDLGRLIDAHRLDGEAGMHKQVQTATTTVLREFLWSRRMAILNCLKAFASGTE